MIVMSQEPQELIQELIQELTGVKTI